MSKLPTLQKRNAILNTMVSTSWRIAVTFIRIVTTVFRSIAFPVKRDALVDEGTIKTSELVDTFQC